MTKIVSYLRSERHVHTALLKVLMQRRWQNADILELLKVCNYEMHQSQLSIYLKHGIEKKGGITDHDLLILLGMLGISLTLEVNIGRPDEKKIKRHFDYFFPADKYPRENKIQDRLIEFYKKNDMLY